MKTPVVLSIQGCQYYPEQGPEIIELMTDGTLEFTAGGWDICYEESELTGLAGVTTTFRLEPGRVLLRRTGGLRSEMIFQEGVNHDSLYQIEFGALMITVCAKEIRANITERGGNVDLVYSIQIEGMEAGMVEYHLVIRAKE